MKMGLSPWRRVIVGEEMLLLVVKWQQYGGPSQGDQLVLVHCGAALACREGKAGVRRKSAQSVLHHRRDSRL